MKPIVLAILDGLGYREEEKGNAVEMLFHSSHLEHFARWFMMFADEAIILEPENLKIKVRTLIEGAWKNT